MSSRTKFYHLCILVFFGALCSLGATPVSIAAPRNVIILQWIPTATPTPTRSGPFVVSPDGPLIFDLPTPEPFRAGRISLQPLSPLDKSYLAAVKIVGCAYAGATECIASEGSGAIIHPSGLILTALHVVVEDSRNLSSPILPEVGIGIIANVEMQRAVLRYRAKVAAIDATLDLALLQIIQPADGSELNLPTLPVDSITNREFRNASLKVIGFPQGAMDLKGPSVDFFGMKGAAVEVQAQLVGVGFSGSPLLVQKGDRFYIGGVAFFRTEDGLVLVQPIQQVNHLRWLNPPVPPAWGQEVQISPTNAGGVAGLTIAANIHVVDQVGQKLRLQAVAYDLEQNRPWPSAVKPLAFRKTFEATRFIDVVPLTLSTSLFDIGPLPDHLRFVLQVWDESESRLLWNGEAFYSPPSATATATSTATATATFVIATATRTPTTMGPTATKSPISMRTVESTATPNRAATTRAQATVTARIRSTATALALTRDAQRVKPTPTRQATATLTPGSGSNEWLRSKMLDEMQRSSIRNNYPQQSEWLVDELIAHLDEFQLQSMGITETTMRSALSRNGVGDRLNAIVHEVMGDPGASPFRQLVYRLIQGRQGVLIANQQHGLYNYFTRPENYRVWSENIDGVIGAVNRESFLWP